MACFKRSWVIILGEKQAYIRPPSAVPTAARLGPYVMDTTPSNLIINTAGQAELHTYKTLSDKSVLGTFDYEMHGMVQYSSVHPFA
eukprot:4267193-Amphidinium_carterae.1